MGLELFSPDDDSAAVVTAARVPDGIDGTELLRHLRDRHGVTLAPGQGDLKGRIFRIGHIGWFDVFDIAAALAAVELSLTELGAEIERGVAVAARVRGVRAARPRRSARRRSGPSRSSASPACCAPPRSTRPCRSSPRERRPPRPRPRPPAADLDRIVKSLVFVCDGAYVLALVPGDRRGDERRVAAAAGAAEARIARAPEVVEATGFEPGGVAPFPHRAVDGRLIERLLFQHRPVWIGAGHELAHGLARARRPAPRLSAAQAADLVAPR